MHRPEVSASLRVSLFTGGLLVGTFLLREVVGGALLLVSLVTVMTDSRDPFVRALFIQSDILYRYIYMENRIKKCAVWVQKSDHSTLREQNDLRRLSYITGDKSHLAFLHDNAS